MKTNKAKIFEGVLAAAVCLGLAAPARAFWTDGGKGGGAMEQLGLSAEAGGPARARINPAEVSAAPASKELQNPAPNFKVVLLGPVSGRDIVREFRTLREGLLRETTIKHVLVDGCLTTSKGVGECEAEKIRLDEDPATGDEIKISCTGFDWNDPHVIHQPVVTYKEKDGSLLKEVYDEYVTTTHRNDVDGIKKHKQHRTHAQFTTIVDEATGVIVRTGTDGAN